LYRHADVADAAKPPRDAEIETDRFRVTNVQITFGSGGKRIVDLFVFSGTDILRERCRE